MTDQHLNLKGIVRARADASQYLKQAGDAVIVERQGPRWLILCCPCGCGAELPVNLDRRAGPAWRLYQSHKGLSLYPSVWRDSGCESHFIILRNKIWMMGSRFGETTFEDSEISDEDLAKGVLAALSAQYQSAESLSDRIPGSVPWDVMQACRKLCRRGFASEGRGAAIGQFRRREQTSF